MTNELLIGLGGLILSGLTYFAGVWRTERRTAKEDRNARIQRVFDRYMEFRRTNHTGGTDGLQKAGVATLCSNDEILELVELIVHHGEKHPLGADHEMAFSGVNLLSLFSYAAENRVNFLQTPLEEIIKASNQQ